jgi:8-amino-7-oxononanoate synthase
MHEELRHELERLRAVGLHRTLPASFGPQQPRQVMDGTTVVHFSSNDYLGLANHPALLDAARSALEADGFGAGASRLVTGTFERHRTLEAKLAHWKGTESALLFGSGYQANIGTLSALAGPEDVVYSDQLNHASLIDGCRLSRATTRVYPHRDAAALGRLLAADGGRFRRRFVVTDSVFSMDGDQAPIPELVALCSRFDALLYLDEAHSGGVLGIAGRGLANDLACEHLAVGTLGKAFGAYGAYVAGPRVFIDYLVQRARSFIFTTALPPAVCAASSAALDLIAGREGDKRRARLQALASHFSTELRALRIHVPDGLGHIVPLVAGSPAAALELSRGLLSRGVFVPAIRPPTVPPGTSRIRFALSAAHSDADLQLALDAIAERKGLLT